MKQGGQRANSGRKQKAVKKKQVYAMIPEDKIDILGEEKTKDIMVQAIYEAVEEIIEKEGQDVE